ncbi:hypothetical protein ACA910_002559 [Epithemia clementina (nom. ined.)]
MSEPAVVGRSSMIMSWVGSKLPRGAQSQAEGSNVMGSSEKSELWCAAWSPAGRDGFPGETGVKREGNRPQEGGEWDDRTEPRPEVCGGRLLGGAPVWPEVS